MGMFEDQKNIWGNLIKGFSNNPNNRQLANILKEGTRQAIGLTVADIPLSAKEAYDYAQKGEYLNSGLSAAAMIPGVPALGGLVKGQNIYRGTQRAPDLATVSQRLQNPGNEFGMHVTRDPSTADLMQYNYQTGGKGGVIGMQSNVGNPLVLPDTGGRWTPDIVADSILSNSTNKALKSDVEKFKAEYAYNQATGNKDMDMWSKRLQEMIKSHGYDHISYENVKEGVPSESAILFDKGGFKNPHTDTTVPKIQGFHGSKTPLSGDVSLNFSGKTSGIPEERAFWLAPTKDEALKFADMAGGNHVTSFDINNSRVKQIPVSIQDITKNTLNKAEEIGKAKQEGFDVLHFVYPKSEYISLEDEFAVINPQVLQKTGEGYNKQFDNLHYTDPFPDTTR